MKGMSLVPIMHLSNPTPDKNKGMQIPGKKFKRLAKGVKRHIDQFSIFTHVTWGSTKRQHVTIIPQFGPHTSPSTPSSPVHDLPFVDILRDFIPPPLTTPASPRSGTSSDTLKTPSIISELHTKEMDQDGVEGMSSSASSSRRSDSSSFADDASEESGLTEKSAAGDSNPLTAPLIEEVEGQAPPIPAESDEGSPLSDEPHTPELTPKEIVEERSSMTSPEVPMFTSPPQQYVETDGPDPFLVDDPEDPMSDDEDDESHGSQSQQIVAQSPAEEIPLTLPSSPLPGTHHSALPISSNLNKAVPPPPSSESDQDEEAPDLYLPGLIIPTMFLPIPNTDPLTTLLTKYIYPPEKRPMRDLTGDWQRSDFHTLVMTNSWRALARMARDRIVATDPEELTLILGLWYLRLACLARLRLFNQTSAECTNLFTVLNAIEPPASREWLFDRILPFELEVMHARLKYWAGDHMAYLDALNALLKKCKTKARLSTTDAAGLAMWQERGARICLIIASQLMEMKDFSAAAKLLEPLCNQSTTTSSPALRSSIARIYLQGGYLQMASKHFAAVVADPTAEQSMKDMNAGLLASAEGEWTKASEALRSVLEQDAENYVAVNNLSVALLSQGKLKEGIEVLETALKSSPSSVVVAEPFLFNLSTLYELRSASAVEKKRDLLIEVAKWSGDGLKTTCLKMPTN